jgi:hypothetical protein
MYTFTIANPDRYITPRSYYGGSHFLATATRAQRVADKANAEFASNGQWFVKSIEHHN